MIRSASLAGSRGSQKAARHFVPGLEFGHLERLLGVIYAPKVATELSPGLNGAKIRVIWDGLFIGVG